MKVLVAEDDLISRCMLVACLTKWGYETIIAPDGAEAWRILEQDDPPAMAVLDWMMPGMDGVEICRKLRKRRQEPYIYVLLLTARTGKENLLEGLESGADDYLSKPFDAQELEARLRSGRRIIELQGQLVAAREALRIEASRDPLTGLWNRAAILGFLQRELARAWRQGTPVAVIIADLDHFKTVNDSYGHLAGDAVLREATRRMASSIRNYDAIGRYGGEEIMVVAPDCDLTGALKLAGRLRECVGREPVDIRERKIPVSVSLGVAVGTEEMEPESLIHAADAALYQAKNSGRNRVQAALTQATGSPNV